MHRFYKSLLALLVGMYAVRSSIADDQQPLDAAPSKSFSIVVLPDTQVYAARNPELFTKQIDWIIKNSRAQNIKFVSHVGDIVDDYESDDQWQVARRAMIKLHGRIPYGFSLGNHDMLSNGHAQNFIDQFPAELYADFRWYGGQFKNNANSYQLFSAGDLEMMVLHLECNAPDDVLEWANDVLTRNSKRRVVVTTHMYLGPRDRPKTARDYFDAPKGRMTWSKRHGKRGNSPQQMWEKCLSRHANIFLICCGDQSRTQSLHTIATGVHGNLVHECLSDYSGDGSLRLYRLLPAQNEIRVITYNVATRRLTTESKYAKDITAHQFSVSYRMTAD